MHTFLVAQNPIKIKWNQKVFYTQVVNNVRFMNLFLVHNITLFTRCSLDADAAKNLIGCFFKLYIMCI